MRREIYFDGQSFHQAEVTSCGLNGGPLRDEGRYEARIACHLYSKNGTTESLRAQQDENHPAFTQEGADREDNPNQYIENMRDGATAGYRYFDFQTAKIISVETRGSATGVFVVRDERGLRRQGCRPHPRGAEQQLEKLLRTAEHYVREKNRRISPMKARARLISTALRCINKRQQSRRKGLQPALLSRFLDFLPSSTEECNVLVSNMRLYVVKTFENKITAEYVYTRI